MTTPPADFDITPALIDALLSAQHPDLLELPRRYLSSGWDNAIYRLGDQYLLRLPRRAQAVPLLEREQAWLPKLAPRLSIPVPAPVRSGRPQAEFPRPWSVTPFYPGEPAAAAPPAADEALRLARFLRELHRPPPPDTPRNPYRGCPLRERAPDTEARLQRLLAAGLITTRVSELWAAALAAHDDRLEPRLLHGDLHPRNLIVHRGRITAVIDWGDITAGDAATDLAAFWLLFPDAGVRQAALNHYGADSQLRDRSVGWAVFFGALLLEIGLGGDPVFEQVGRRALRHLETLKTC